MTQSANVAVATQTANASQPFFTPDSFMARINASDRVNNSMAGQFLKFRVRRVSPNIFPAEQGGKPMVDRDGNQLMRQIVTTSLWNDSLYASPEAKALLAEARAAWKAGDKQLAHDKFQAIENLCSVEYGHILGRREVPASGRLMEGTLALITSKLEGKGQKLVLDGVTPVASVTIGKAAKLTSLWDDEEDADGAIPPAGEGNGLPPSGDATTDASFEAAFTAPDKKGKGKGSKAA
jgi:hypothetical protein